ncbi:MAG: inositol monophosphatase family protein [Desulfotignum sp.]|nr:inositol monophosphatase family protein [Desulfotignum sp.]
MQSFLKEIIVQAGDICLEKQGRLTPDDLMFKARKDLVTATDRQVEAFLVEQIHSRFPDHGVWGEETGRTSTGSEYCWIIDPIDGTTSFFHGQPYYAVSIALKKGQEIISGAVYAPALGQLFQAGRKEGAWLNDHPLHVSATTTLTDAVMATGFACLRAGLEPNNLIHFNRIVPRLRDIRRCGSAAVDLCYVAAGKLDGFWELNLNVYDVAAGVLMVTEAGGVVTDFTGGPDFPEKGIVAANRVMADILITQLTA